MGKIFLVCPNCKTRLSFPEVPGYQDKIVDCPICHFKAQANVYQSGALAQGGQGSDNEATQMPGAMMQQKQATSWYATKQAPYKKWWRLAKSAEKTINTYTTRKR